MRSPLSLVSVSLDRALLLALLSAGGRQEHSSKQEWSPSFYATPFVVGSASSWYLGHLPEGGRPQWDLLP
ncbi:hypothetical protein AAFF_G00072210 [Aldrovandia affinis]|uniref:Secreted protein n=1 Tax=Aldrovandia affinis TaxID=143900 RepID=A0AAD7RYW3_9TELE|nr:hypothetical protein AAFF_G00072210 [Aldrovandia affinis]